MITNDQARPPAEEAGPVTITSAGREASLSSGPSIFGQVVIDLRIEDGEDCSSDHAVGRAMQAATVAPAGADVTLIVRPGQFGPAWALAYLIENGKHLGSITVECDDPDTIRRWVTELQVLQEAA